MVMSQHIGGENARPLSVIADAYIPRMFIGEHYVFVYSVGKRLCVHGCGRIDGGSSGLRG